MGTKEMMANLVRAYSWDIETRIADENNPKEGVAVVAEDIHEGVVYEKNGVKVTAFEVDHGDRIKPAFGYRIDYAGRSVVISGDTRPSDNLVRYAKGTDVLIHEVAQARSDQLARSETARRIVKHHTTPEEAGRIFSRVKPHLALYSHIALLTTEAGVPALTEKDLVAATRKTYVGPLEVGEDLTTIEIGATVVARRFGSPKN
jgi:ribonuclease Z